MCCRISGTVNYPQSEIIKILEHQKRGGPDLSKFVTYNNVTFGHNLLSIIGYQPQPLENDKYLMTFNGTWYGYKDYYPYSTSDTVSLFDHFGRRGLDAINDVNGQFAIGLLDKQENKLHLIVDRFGQKQLYYLHDGNKFAFASNPASLYPLLQNKEIDKDALQSYWLLGSVMGENGIYKGIKKVCASEVVTFDLLTNDVSTSRYWEPVFRESHDIEGLVYDAIDKVKVSDVPIHIFLSGGIDSTLVASRFQGGDAIHLNSDELNYAKQAAERFNINLKVVDPQDIDVEVCLFDYSSFSGEPTMAGLIPYITAREVSKFGRVAITANGADELFFGYDRMQNYDLQVKGIFRSLDKKIKDKFESTLEVKHHIYRSTPFHKGQLRELYYYVQYDLNKTLDFASMCHGVEIRSPFLDHRLVEMALSIPESAHKKKGNKTILKAMLKNLGFNDKFLNRPKLGFSLTKKPKDLNQHIDKTWKWVQDEGYLEIKTPLSGRDEQYLKMSALGFYYWMKAQ